MMLRAAAHLCNDICLYHPSYVIPFYSWPSLNFPIFIGAKNRRCPDHFCPFQPLNSPRTCKPCWRPIEIPTSTSAPISFQIRPSSQTILPQSHSHEATTPTAPWLPRFPLPTDLVACFSYPFYCCCHRQKSANCQGNFRTCAGILGDSNVSLLAPQGTFDLCHFSSRTWGWEGARREAHIDSRVHTSCRISTSVLSEVSHFPVIWRCRLEISVFFLESWSEANGASRVC